jgi:hypothetical protein
MTQPPKRSPPEACPNGPRGCLPNSKTDAAEKKTERTEFVAAQMLAVPRRGDQIRRIFAQWAIVYFGQFFLITEVALIFVQFSSIKYVFFYKNWFELHFGLFFTSSSGHPGCRLYNPVMRRGEGNTRDISSSSISPTNFQSLLFHRILGTTLSTTEC